MNVRSLCDDHLHPPPEERHPVVLQVRNVSKSYPGTQALKDANLSVRGGAVNVLVGENGAGKSTLMKIIAGVEGPTSGQVLIDGQPVTLDGCAAAAAHGIGMIFQELNLFPNLSITDNIFIGQELRGDAWAIDESEQQRRAAALLARLDHPLDPAGLVSDLRVGEQQIVEIAKALSRNVRVLIMDEPTSALSASEVAVLFRVIGELKSQGVAIVYISHRLEELISIGDYIAVLRDGRITGQQPMANIDVKWIVEKMVGAPTRDFSRAADHQVGAPILTVRDLCLRRDRHSLLVDHVSLTLHAGEIVGVYGLMGAGRTEMFECLFGLQAGATGTVELGGMRLDGLAVPDRIERGMALIPEDRKTEGVLPALSIGRNLTLSSLKALSRWWHIGAAGESASVAAFIRKLCIKVADPELDITSLSGGNQQKVVIGRALMTCPQVLLMDEPSRGIDVGAKADVFKVMRDLAHSGLGILFATSDLEEVMALSDRILVMSNGGITAEFSCADATQDALVRAAAAGH